MARKLSNTQIWWMLIGIFVFLLVPTFFVVKLTIFTSTNKSSSDTTGVNKKALNEKEEVDSSSKTANSPLLKYHYNVEKDSTLQMVEGENTIILKPGATVELCIVRPVNKPIGITTDGFKDNIGVFAKILEVEANQEVCHTETNSAKYDKELFVKVFPK